MSRAAALELLLGGRGVAYGLSWTPTDAMRGRSAEPGDPDDAEILRSVVERLGVDLVFVDSSQPWAARAVELLEAEDTLAVWSVPGVFGRVAEETGWAETLRTSAGEPGALAFPLSEALHDALDGVRAGVDAGADAFVVADDLASSAGWLVSPDFALDALLPCYRSLVAEITGSGGLALFHSDGDVRVLYPALTREGFSAVHLAGLRSQCVEACVAAARRCGLVPVGGVAAECLLVEEPGIVGRRVADLAGDGPLVVCDDGGMTSTADVAAYFEVLRAAQRGVER